jgi:poly(A) polymerase
MAQQQWGTTAPISMELPTEADLKANDALLAELRAQNNFPSTEDTEQRKRVLAHLQRVTEELIRAVGKKKGLSQSALENAGGKVFTFGSYRLGVYGPGKL